MNCPPSPSTPRRAAFLVIGNEILSGKTQDTNTAPLAQLLGSIGIRLARVNIVPDDIDTIAQEVRALSDSYDVVVTSGGIGPTHDDVTVAAVAKAFGTTVAIEPRMAALLRTHFQEQTTDAHLLMARIPVGCDLLTDDNPWPTIRMKNVWVLPGIPEIFLLRLQAIRSSLHAATPFLSRSVYTNVDEPDLVPLLNRVVEHFPDLDIGSYPQWSNPHYKTQITFDGRDEEQVRGAVEEFVAGLPLGEPLRTV